MHCYNHPIIHSLMEMPHAGKSDLYRLTGMTNPREFINQLNKLIKEDHINTWDWFYRPRVYYLTQYINGVRFQQIKVPYIVSKDLAALLEFTEPDEITQPEQEFDFHLFIAQIRIEQPHKGLFERLCGVELDLERYNYYLGAEYLDMVRTPEPPKIPPTIVHLDDHSIFSAGLKKGVIDRYFSDCEFHYFEHVDNAIEFIQNKFSKDEKIDLIITDFNHIGYNGYEFIKIVRELEIDFRCLRTPSICLTMAFEDPRVKLGEEDKTFDKCLPKSASVEEITAVCNDLMNRELPY